MTTDYHVGRIDHVELFVPDVEEAAQWYEGTLGLTVVEAFREWADGGGPLMLSSDGGATKLALFAGEPQDGQPSRGYRRLAFETGADGFRAFVEETASALLVFDRDAARIDGVDPVDHGLSFSAYFHDPYGNPLEITTYEHEAVRIALDSG